MYSNKNSLPVMQIKSICYKLGYDDPWLYIRVFAGTNGNISTEALNDAVENVYSKYFNRKRLLNKLLKIAREIKTIDNVQKSRNFEDYGLAMSIIDLNTEDENAKETMKKWFKDMNYKDLLYVLTCHIDTYNDIYLLPKCIPDDIWNEMIDACKNNSLPTDMNKHICDLIDKYW